MDAIQLALDVPLQRTIQNSHRFFKRLELSEAAYPLLVSHLEWLRKINAAPNPFDVMHQNEQRKQEFKFLFKHNLLFFLTVTRQFNVINKLFKTPSFTSRLRHLFALIRKAHFKARQRKKKRWLFLKFKEKTLGYNLARTMHAYHTPQNRFDKKNPYSLFGAQNSRKIKKNGPTYPVNIDYVRNILKKIHRSANMKSLINKTLLREITAIHQHASKNKATLHTSFNPNEGLDPRSSGFLSELLEQADADGLDLSVFNSYNHSFFELAEIDTEESTAAKEFQNGLEELNPEHHGLQNEWYSAKTDDALTEDIETDLDFLKCSEHSIDGKKSFFDNPRLTFFSTLAQNNKEMASDIISHQTMQLRVGS
ncbi:hypothetical protein Lche_0732 [Legionella cherrii]|uniref:Uncharacterized protein n=2 Tax=Legionella cherrii TaxID=28084 RepID=A0A0W0SH37_9GAMM|nr:hypothetical protein [Legionella cherrii]KTC82468.1 hypothetical protein Lche_0732 [Legionella cherrii]